jgi:hypothetical protein
LKLLHTNNLSEIMGLTKKIEQIKLIDKLFALLANFSAVYLFLLFGLSVYEFINVGILKNLENYP